MRLEVTGKIQKAEIQKKLCRRKDKGHRSRQRKTQRKGLRAVNQTRETGQAQHRKCWEGRQGRCVNS